MKKILIKKILNCVKNEENFENRMVDALRIGASEENFLCILCEGIIESAYIPENAIENFLQHLKKVEKVGDNLQITEVSIRASSEEILVNFTSETTSFFRSEKEAKEGNRYSGSSEKTDEYCFKGVVVRKDYHNYSVETFEEFGGIVVRK